MTNGWSSILFYHSLVISTRTCIYSACPQCQMGVRSFLCVCVCVCGGGVGVLYLSVFFYIWICISCSIIVFECSPSMCSLLLIQRMLFGREYGNCLLPNCCLWYCGLHRVFWFGKEVAESPVKFQSPMFLAPRCRPEKRAIFTTFSRNVC